MKSKQIPKIQQTSNYDLFECNPEQREIHTANLNEKVDILRAQGWFPTMPMQCYMTGRKLVVVDGHHRLLAARLLGIPVYYVVGSSELKEMMVTINRGVRWKNADFLNRECARGNKDCMTLQNYVNKGIPLTCAVSMLGGQSAGSGNLAIRIAEGTFKVKTTKHADFILELIEGYPSIPHFKHSGFIKALDLCLWLPEFDLGMFKHRAVTYWHMIRRCSNVDDFLRAIEEVYNFRSSKKIPVFINAKAAAKKRNVVG